MLQPAVRPPAEPDPFGPPPVEPFPDPEPPIELQSSCIL